VPSAVTAAPVPQSPRWRMAVRVAGVSAKRAFGARWRRGQHGWPASFPIAQFPNAPLLVALGGWLVAALTNGSVHACARAVFYVALAVWAWEELAGGVNWLRGVFGVCGLVYVVVHVGAALGA
jgi:hypothetical protein